MATSYNPYYSGGWQSGEEGNTPITPDALNHMETGIGDAFNYTTQSTAVETISQSDFITLASGIQIERWDGAKKSGKIVQASFVISKSDGTSFGNYQEIGTINNPYHPLMRFTKPVSIASSISDAIQINGNSIVRSSGGIAIYASASNSNVVYVSMTYMTN